jgi:hypothetical protein
MGNTSGAEIDAGKQDSFLAGWWPKRITNDTGRSTIILSLLYFSAIMHEAIFCDVTKKDCA